MHDTQTKILLGVSAGIAAYKAPELVRLLQRENCKLQTIMTKRATHFIGAETFRALTGLPVGMDEFTDVDNEAIAHIRYADEYDLLLIAPASADIIAKLACGIADDLLTTTALAFHPSQLVLAPAMNTKMYEHPATQKNIKTLMSRGVHIVEPACGLLACGVSGQGKLADLQDIVEACLLRVDELKHSELEKDLVAQRVLITLGPTHEPFDPVRYIGNHSSGKMGLALVSDALKRGAQVHAVCGPLAPGTFEKYLPREHQNLQIHSVTTAQEMHGCVQQLLEEYSFDFIICSAAVADFRPVRFHEDKIKKGAQEKLSLDLVKNPDILAELSALKQKGELASYLVGFAAETSDIETYAYQKISNKPVDALVVNDVSAQDRGFCSDNNAAFVLAAELVADELHIRRLRDFCLMSKQELAHALWNLFVTERLGLYKNVG